MAPEDIQSQVSKAEKYFRAGKYKDAADLFQFAEDGYLQAGDTLKAAEMANNRSVALLQSGDGQGALKAAEGTDQIFAQAGNVQRQALAIGNQAAALEATNRLNEALDRYFQCNALLKQIGDEENRVMVLKSISALQIRTGHSFEALASMDTALNNQKKLGLQERFLKKLLDIPMRKLSRR